MIRKFLFIPIRPLGILIYPVWFFHCRFKGCECSTFSNLSPKQLLKPNNADDFNYFIVVRVNGRIQSAPIFISKLINRTAFGIAGEDRNVRPNLFTDFLELNDQHISFVRRLRWPHQ